MKIRQIIYLILILFAVISCGKNEETDEKILSDIFPELIDSLSINRTNLIPSPPPPIYDKDSIFIGVDSVAEKLINKKHKQILSRINSIDSRLIIGLVDTNINIDLVDLRHRSYSDNLLINEIIKNNERIDKPKLEWDINLIQTPSDFHLVSESNLKRRYSDIWKINDRKFGGLIAISKLYFNKNKKAAVLQFETHPFRHEGASYFVIIKRSNDKWKVKRILMNWIT